MSSLQKIANLEYKRVGEKSLLLDLDLPDNRGKPTPVVVWIHGGGWYLGSKDEWQPPKVVVNALLERGYAVASISYRFSNEAIFPAQLEDCKAAIRWLRAHAGDYDFDADHIGAYGYSAGGHLAALLGTTADHAEFDVGDNLDCSSRVQAVCTFALPTDFSVMGGHHNDSDSPESRLIGGTVTERPDLVARANPATYASKTSAPMLLFHGDHDFGVPKILSELLHDALVKAGADSTLYIIEGADHGMGGMDDAAIQNMVTMACEFFDRHLRR
nr:lipolytic protein [uncultured bacterium]